MGAGPGQAQGGAEGEDDESDGEEAHEPAPSAEARNNRDAREGRKGREGRQESRWQPRGGSGVASSAGAAEDVRETTSSADWHRDNAAASQQASEHVWQPRDGSSVEPSGEHAADGDSQEAPQGVPAGDQHREQPAWQPRDERGVEPGGEAEDAWTHRAPAEAQRESEAAPASAYERSAQPTPPPPATEPAEPGEPQRVFHRVFDRPRDEQADHDHSASEQHEPSSPAHDRSDRSDDREPSQS